MYSVTAGYVDVNGTAKFGVPMTVSLEQFAITSARQWFVSKSIQRAAKDVSRRSWTIRDTIWRTFCDRGAVYKYDTIR